MATPYYPFDPFNDTTPTVDQGGTWNSINANPGRWGVNPYYLTPGYTANMRPQYYNPGETMGDVVDPGFLESIWRSNPIGYDLGNHGWYANVPQTTGAYADSLAYKPIDSAVSLGGTLGGIGAFFAAQRVLERRAFVGSNPWTNFKAGSMRGINRAAAGAGFGRVFDADAIHKAGSTVQFGSRFGYRTGARATKGLVRGLGGAGFANGAIGRGLVGFGGVVGAGAMAIGGSLALGAGISWAGNQLFADPYKAHRQTTDALRDNFSNVVFSGDGAGQHGFGMTAQKASEIASELTRTSIKDFGATVGTYGQVANFAAKAGILNDISNLDTQTIVNRIKDITKQVKVVMAVANEPSLQEAVNMIARLKQAGASDKGGLAGSVLRQVGMYAATSGISPRQMLETVGAAGQMTAQQMGISGYVGLREAARSHAIMAATYRTGRMSDASASTMGGVEGAAQYAMNANMALAMDKYNQVRLANRYMFGGKQDGLVNNMTAFGNSFANNPLATSGAMFLFGGRMASAQLSQSPEDVLTGVYERMDMLPGTKNENGQYDAMAMAAVMRNMGMDEKQVEAVLTQMSGISDPATRSLMSEAASAQGRKELAAYKSAHGIYGQSVLGRTTYAIKSLAIGAQEGTSYVGTGLSSAASYVRDKFDETINYLVHGVSKDPLDTKAEAGNASFSGMSGRGEDQERFLLSDERDGVDTGLFGKDPDQVMGVLREANAMRGKLDAETNKKLDTIMAKHNSAVKSGDKAAAAAAMQELTKIKEIKGGAAFQAMVQEYGGVDAAREAAGAIAGRAAAYSDIQGGGGESKLEQFYKVMDETNQRTSDDARAQLMGGGVTGWAFSKASGWFSSNKMSAEDRWNKMVNLGDLQTHQEDIGSLRDSDPEKLKRMVSFLNTQGEDLDEDATDVEISEAASRVLSNERKGNGDSSIVTSGIALGAAGQSTNLAEADLSQVKEESVRKRGKELQGKLRGGSISEEEKKELLDIAMTATFNRSGANSLTGNADDTYMDPAALAKEKDILSTAAEHNKKMANFATKAAQVDFRTFERMKADLESSSAKMQAEAADKQLEAANIALGIITEDEAEKRVERARKTGTYVPFYGDKPNVKAGD